VVVLEQDNDRRTPTTPRVVRRRQTVFVGEKIRQIRKTQGMTQSELARRIGVQQSDLCRMETGEYKVALDTLLRILVVFGLEIGEFFRGEAAREPSNDRELELLRLFHRLDTSAQDEVLDFLRYKGARRIEAL
jgi:transcriptional regulator with XRE-family HTH domain